MADTLKGRKAYICATPQPDDLDLTAYKALTWIEIGQVGMIGESGTKTNLVNYDTLDTDVTQKAKGISNAGDPTIECARDEDDPGQVELRVAGLTKAMYAVKFVDDDTTGAFIGTSYYNRGVVTGPTRPNGRNESFNLEVFTFGLNQLEIVDGPVALSVPVNTLLPSISGIADVSSGLLTAIVGSWTNSPTSYTYQWQMDTAGNNTYANIGGATSATLDPAAGQLGNSIRVQVTAHNAAGASAAASSGGTALTVA